jgi:hypothetical protein
VGLSKEIIPGFLRKPAIHKALSPVQKKIQKKEPGIISELSTGRRLGSGGFARCSGAVLAAPGQHAGRIEDEGKLGAHVNECGEQGIEESQRSQDYTCGIHRQRAIKVLHDD